MKKKAEGMSLRETFAIHRRAARDMRRIAPGCFMPFILCAVVEAASPYAVIWLSARLVDELSTLCRPEILAKWVLWIVAVSAAAELLKAVLERWENVRSELLDRQKEVLYTEKFLRMDYADCDRQETRDLFSQIRQNADWSGWGFAHLKLYYTQAVQGITGILGAAALTVSLFTRQVPTSAGKLTALNHPLFLVGILLLIAAVTCLGPALAGRAYSAWNTLAEQVCFGNRVFSHFVFMQPGDKEKDMDRRMYRQNELAEHYVRTVNIFGVGSPVAKASQTTVGLSKALAASLSAVLSGVVYVFVCLKALGGAFGIGSVTQYVSAVTTFSGNAALLLSTVSHMRANAEFLKAIYTFLDIPNSMYQGSLTTEKRSDRQYDVEFRDVSFRYPGSDIWALRHVNMRFKVGKRLAIVGENGSGKTTFIKLLCRLYDPQEGQILLNGIDIRKYRYDDYMGIFSVVFQDFQLICQFFGRRTTFVFLLKLREGFADLIQRTHLIQRQTYDTRLLGQSLQNGLTYPPYCITDKLETTCFIKLFGCFYQTQITLINQVGQTQTLILILLGYRYNETQIGTCQLLQCNTVTLTDALSELYLLFDSNKVLTANFL